MPLIWCTLQALPWNILLIKSALLFQVRACRLNQAILLCLLLGCVLDYRKLKLEFCMSIFLSFLRLCIRIHIDWFYTRFYNVFSEYSINIFSNIIRGKYHIFCVLIISSILFLHMDSLKRWCKNSLTKSYERFFWSLWLKALTCQPSCNRMITKELFVTNCFSCTK